MNIQCMNCLWDEIMTKLDKEIQAELYDPETRSSLKGMLHTAVDKLFDLKKEQKAKAQQGKRLSETKGMKRSEDAIPEEQAHFLRMQRDAMIGLPLTSSTADYGTKKHTGSYIAKLKKIENRIKKSKIIAQFFKKNPHELINESRGDGISSYGQKTLLAQGVDWEDDDILIAEISEKLIKPIKHEAGKLLLDPIKTYAGIPARWYEAMVKGIKNRSDVRNPYAIVKNIWLRLPAHTKQDIKRRAAKGEAFKYNLPLPKDLPTHGTGTLRMVKPFKLAEAQVNVNKKDMQAVRKSGIFKPMKRQDGSTCQVARCKSGKGNVNIFADGI